MRSSFAATLLICGTLLLLCPFAYHLGYYSQQSYVLAHRENTTPNDDWGKYGPTLNLVSGAGVVQALIGALGLVMIGAGFIGGSGVLEKKSKDKDVRVPLDIILKAHAAEQPAAAAPEPGATPAQPPEKIGVRRIA